MQSDSNPEEEKDDKLSFGIPGVRDLSAKRPKLEFEITKELKKNQKLDFEIKREPQKSTQDYLEILKKLNILLNSHSITEAQRRDYCKSQRYFMKLYLDKVRQE